MTENTSDKTVDKAEKTDRAIAQATSLTEEALNMIDNKDFEKAIYLSGMALEIVTKECGEMGFATCKFYYSLADAELSKIENSNDPLSNGGATNALTSDSIENNLGKLPDVIAESKSKVREMFEQMAQMGAPPVQEKEMDSKPKEEIAPKSTTENTSSVSEAQPQKKQENGLKKEETAPQKEESPKKEENKDNPRIENEEEEEIITTTKESKNEVRQEKSEKQGPVDEDDYSDEFRAPWENLEVALWIFNKTKEMHENSEEFEQINWNLKADILERSADLEVARENLKEGIKHYNLLIDLCVKHNCDRAKSRTIAGILYKIGCSFQLLSESHQAALDSFYEASNILSGILIEEIKVTNPEEGNQLKIQDLKDNEKLKKVEVASDKAKDLQGIIMEINNKIEEWKQSMEEKPLLDKAKEKTEKENTFKKPVFEEKTPMNLGSFGKGKKRTHEDIQKKEDRPKKEQTIENIEDHKRQKVEESS